MRFSGTLLLLLIAVAGCGDQFMVKDRDRVGMSDSQATGRAAVDAHKRDRVPRLTEQFLFSDEPLSKPVQMSDFAAPDDATLVAGVTTGALQLVSAKADGFDVHDDRFGYVSESGGQLAAFPDVSFTWVQQDGFVIPTDQGVLRLTNPYWEIAFQTGRAWAPASDPDVVRYSVPFALLERNANCTHNGVLSWVVNGTGTPSRAVYQIASETCAYFKFDMYGTLRTKNKPGPDVDTQGLIAELEQNRQARLPVQPFDSLAERYPSID
ncbi:MAG: hypothetical protein KJN72_10780, partial [Woeseia sp.]|nr:hypothetical protein [Woeseia sp.]